jgi:hypothetical protein
MAALAAQLQSPSVHVELETRMLNPIVHPWHPESIEVIQY